MRRLGELLVAKGSLTSEQLLQALRQKETLGYRLGTCLLDLSHLNEEQLLRTLSEQLHVPYATADEFRAIPRSVLEMVPVSMVRTAMALPFDHFGSEVSVAMLDPNDLTLLDQIAFVVGRRIKPYIGLEVRIFEALERYYLIKAESRYALVWERLNRNRDGETIPNIATVRAEYEEVLPRIDLGDVDIGPESTAVVESGPQPVLPQQTAVAVDEPVPREAEREEERPLAPVAPPSAAELDLTTLSERDEVAEALLQFLLKRFRRVVFYMVRGDEVAGWMGGGDGVDEVRLKQFRVGFDEPSLFLNLRQGCAYFEGPLSPLPAHRAMASLWGGVPTESCLALPLRVGRRLVGAVYCDRPSPPPAGEELKELQRLAGKASLAFQLVIIKKKLRED